MDVHQSTQILLHLKYIRDSTFTNHKDSSIHNEFFDKFWQFAFCRSDTSCLQRHILKQWLEAWLIQYEGGERGGGDWKGFQLRIRYMEKIRTTLCFTWRHLGHRDRKRLVTLCDRQWVSSHIHAHAHTHTRCRHMTAAKSLLILL